MNNLNLGRLAVALSKWEEAKQGGRPVISHAMLDLLSGHFADDDSADASRYFNASRTIHNPNRVGVHDGFILYL